ncbi:proline dehydrogenase family protein [Novosphingobium mangrovi (ex Huang et al. 2023)]|uniref:Proline dehydrogenase family protein n=1 Tax=Novosphingobium mangrovi (ex Huang et al. 2023) TaxID=2976432 RepID=A0ABT2I2V3_9SPHN|nr:proline dehydrogenase family protein [Novosphingobium mangrovi (ex Huang et al. 2023)]MCT2398937.1 proline dehydrogenase family protein [Novosphingobium mangrovi (ex Huang et al. 2023)]
MSVGLSTRLRTVLARTVEALAPVSDAAAAARGSRRLERRGIAATLSYFGAWDGVAAGIVEACGDLAGQGPSPGTCLAIKAPPLYFDKANLRAVAGPASVAGMTVVFDSLTHQQAGETLDLAEWMAGEFPSVGVALPARWRRSVADAARFRDAPMRIRLIKGEWADPGGDVPDIAAAYLDLARTLAGRRAPVGVASHDPVLAEEALRILLAAGTPCELEQLRGLPGHRTRKVARALDVPVRLYCPFGPGWWPYAADKLLERPYLPWWWIRDMLG